MSAAADRLTEFLNHPAPGLVFTEHEGHHVPERAHATPHRAGKPLSRLERCALARLTAVAPGPLAPLVEVYSRYNGAELCMLHDRLNRRDVAALRLLPIRQWKRATRPWLRGGQRASFMDGCEMYAIGDWRVIGHLSSEGQSLAMFFDGQYEGQQLAGRMFCIALDGRLGYEELLSPDFGAFIREFTANPVTVFDRIGFTWYVSVGNAMYGDVVGAYLPDIHRHPALQEWPRS